MKSTFKIVLGILMFAALLLPLISMFWGQAALVSAPANKLGAPVIGSGVRSAVTPVAVLGCSLWPVTRSLFQGTGGDQLVLGSSFTLESGESLDGSLIVLGGSATLEEGSTVGKDVVLMGGTLKSNGAIQGDVVTFGGLVELGKTAVVGGDVNVMGGRVDRDPEARIEGEVNSTMRGPIPSIVIPDSGNWTPDVQFNPFWDGLWYLFRSFMWAALAVLAVLFMPKQIDRMAHTAMGQPLIAGGLGLLTVMVAPLLLVVTAITIIGIPVTLIGAFLLVLVWAFGIIVIGLEVGRRLSHAFKQEWALPVSAGLGTFVLTLVTNGVGGLLPCVGWIVPAVVGMIGTGAVLLTRFGMQDYPPYGGGTALTATPPAPFAPVVTEIPEVEYPGAEPPAGDSTAGDSPAGDENQS